MDMRKLLRWQAASIATWIAFGVVNGTQVVVGMRAEGMHHPWARLFAVHALSWVPWAIFSPAIILLAQRFPTPRTWYVHLATYLAIGIADAAWTVGVDLTLQPMAPQHPTDWLRATISFFYSKFHLDLLIYAGLFGLARVMDSRETLKEREEQLATARLDALIRQLQPHFLFNTLNGISGLVRTGDSKTAVTMIAGLSDLLRRVIDGRASTHATLGEEVGFAQKYLDLQKMRFAERLQVTYDIPDDLLHVRVPSMILQPLIENALEHGIGKLAKGGAVIVSARRMNGQLVLTIANDGPTLEEAREGVGIANTRARLVSMYGEVASFALQSNAAGMTEAMVRTPLHG